MAMFPLLDRSGYMPVVPMTLVSALLKGVVSRLTRPPSEAALARYFTTPPARPERA